MEYILNMIIGFIGGILGALTAYWFLGREADERVEIKEEDLDRYIL